MIKKTVKALLRSLGIDVVRHRQQLPAPKLPLDLSEDDRKVIQQIQPFTMTSIERQVTLIQSVRHVVKNQIAGSFVECGVWRGGSSMAMALALQQEGQTDRDLYLFDTFEGMTQPTDFDKTDDGTLAQELLKRDNTRKSSVWAVAGIEDVQQNMRSTNYPQQRIHFCKGPVELTIPTQSPPGPIAILRLDTDWYESTKHELTHLFPQLCEGGVMIIDDYGHWAGARQAVDEFLASTNAAYFLHRIDYTGRLLIKR